jgi:YidC/Oxa1 family membrane protein insertase
LNPWELIIQQPVINVLIAMSHYLYDSFGLAIIALTIIVNVLMLYLTLKQIRSTKAMQELQPKLAEIQKKYSKDRQKLAQEQMRLYRESGVKPAGCAITLVIQMPVWIALYQSIILTLAVAPEGLLNLSKYLYSWQVVYSVLPLSQEFLWFNMAKPDFILAILVGGTMWLQQKMSMTLPTDPKQRSQSQMMLWMMPLMFAFLALSFPSGLSLYWVTSSIVRIILQYRVTGWGGLVKEAGTETSRDRKYVKFIDREEEKTVDNVGADIVVTDEERQKRDQGLGYPEAPSKARYRPGKDREQHRRRR